MKEDQHYIQDIAAMRSMMERSSKFMSLSGLAGILAGIYALSGAYIAYKFLYSDADLINLILLAISVLILAIGSAIFLSWKKAAKRREKVWNSTARRLAINMAVPLIAGGLLILILIGQGMITLMAPFTLLFYGLALYNASKFTYDEVKSLGLIEIGLGLISSYFTEYALLFWAVGFGLVHIIYGMYIHYRYER
jgi:hypothetical protein